VRCSCSRRIIRPITSPLIGTTRTHKPINRANGALSITSHRPFYLGQVVQCSRPLAPTTHSENCALTPTTHMDNKDKHINSLVSSVADTTHRPACRHTFVAKTKRYCEWWSEEDATEGGERSACQCGGRLPCECRRDALPLAVDDALSASFAAVAVVVVVVAVIESIVAAVCVCRAANKQTNIQVQEEIAMRPSYLFWILR
jgi:hypothetical protein